MVWINAILFPYSEMPECRQRSTREGAMSYSKAGKVKDFSSSVAPKSGLSAALHTALVGVCFAFVAAVVLGLVP
jgi:hypothetical protein